MQLVFAGTHILRMIGTRCSSYADISTQKILGDVRASGPVRGIRMGRKDEYKIKRQTKMDV